MPLDRPALRLRELPLAGERRDPGALRDRHANRDGHRPKGQPGVQSPIYRLSGAVPKLQAAIREDRWRKARPLWLVLGCGIIDPKSRPKIFLAESPVAAFMLVGNSRQGNVSRETQKG